MHSYEQLPQAAFLLSFFIVPEGTRNREEGRGKREEARGIRLRPRERLYLFMGASGTLALK
jgi:hypothetical protein